MPQLFINFLSTLILILKKAVCIIISGVKPYSPIPIPMRCGNGTGERHDMRHPRGRPWRAAREGDTGERAPPTPPVGLGIDSAPELSSLPL